MERNSRSVGGKGGWGGWGRWGRNLSPHTSPRTGRVCLTKQMLFEVTSVLQRSDSCYN
ncbi:MAG: hypothetical protein V7K47_27280 [Nostoc sp.]